MYYAPRIVPRSARGFAMAGLRRAGSFLAIGTLTLFIFLCGTFFQLRIGRQLGLCRTVAIGLGGDDT